jgi:glycosyltransferase involved in cell wall biosynthesis
MSSANVIYLSYDRFPSSKGAAVHIDAFVRALSNAFGEIELVTVPSTTIGPPTTLGGEVGGKRNGISSLQSNRYCENVLHTPLPALGGNLVERVMSFRNNLQRWWGDRKPQVVHVRSIFEGYWIARNKQQLCEQFVYEVNGLPSIELKYHYPHVADDDELLRKLQFQETACLKAADLIVTVSQVNAECLIRRGADPERIQVIPNGVDPNLFSYQRPSDWGEREIRLLYSGTLTAWQGVFQALEALALYRRDFPARLILAGEARNRQRKELDRQMQKLGVTDHVEIRGAVSQTELAALHHQCDVVLAPLTANDRNQVQGCCPLKVLEAMASGTPLIASDLPVVEALARSGIDALLVRPGSPKAIKDALLRMRADPHLAPRLSASGRRRIKQQFTWTHAQQALVSAYEEKLGISSLKNRDKVSASRSE